MSSSNYSLHYQPSPNCLRLAAVILFGLPLLLLATALFSTSKSSPLTSLIIVLPITIMAIVLTTAMRRNSIAIENDTIKVRTTFYSFEAPLQSLLPVRAEPTQLIDLGDLMWRRRRNGFSFPGFQSGWFTLRNGKKAFLSVVAQEVVVYASNDGERLLMLGVPEIEKLAAALKKS
jgi:hypothetical protein